MNRILLASLVLISASGWAIAEDLHGTLYKNQSCQCCESHAKYLRENGIDVDVVPVPNYAEISEPSWRAIGPAGLPYDQARWLCVRGPHY